MSDIHEKSTNLQETAVDDVQPIRERLDRESEGDIQKHIEHSKRVLEEYREKVGLKVVQPPLRPKRHDGTDG